MNNNEDETFRRLKREPNWELVKDTMWREQNKAAHEARVKTLEKFGWTMDEFDAGLYADNEKTRILEQELEEKKQEFWRDFNEASEKTQKSLAAVSELLAENRRLRNTKWWEFWK